MRVLTSFIRHICIILEKTKPSLLFLQAEDGIRVYKVTGVQTCALPISAADLSDDPIGSDQASHPALVRSHTLAHGRDHGRSEERRVGKERRGRREPSNGEDIKNKSEEILLSTKVEKQFHIARGAGVWGP